MNGLLKYTNNFIHNFQYCKSNHKAKVKDWIPDLVGNTHDPELENQNSDKNSGNH